MNKSTLVEIKRGEVGHGLLIENDGFMTINETTKNLTEAIGEKGEYFCPDPFIVDVVLQKFGIKNANGRIYPEAILKREVERYRKKLGKNAIGETNHPSEIVIDLSRVSINLIELHWEGHTLVGKMEILISPGFRKYGIISNCADEIANLLLHGIQIGVSSRGLGTVRQEGSVLIVGDDYELVCWDVVSDPSTPGAWISTNGEQDLMPYMEEKQHNGTLITEKIDKISEILVDF